jgi:voltage-gated potassium channel
MSPAAHGPQAIGQTIRSHHETEGVIGDEVHRLLAVEERHRRLLARLLIALGLTLAVAALGSLLIYLFESGKKAGDIHGFGDAVFFTVVQLLTVSSSVKNPLTAAGKIVDVGLEAWAIFIVTAVAGSFASFFTSGDAS